MQENFRAKEKKLYFGFVDLEKAFDRVLREACISCFIECFDIVGLVTKRTWPWWPVSANILFQNK